MHKELSQFDTDNDSREYPKQKSNDNKRKNVQCYTCFLPSGAVQNHIIEIGKYTSFHYDMWNRPYFIATPRYHYHTLFEMDGYEQSQFWSDIFFFMKKMGFDDYQCIFNNGDWQTHHHLHVKIRCDEIRIKDLRHKHLILIGNK